MRLNESSCKVFHLGCGNPHYHKLGDVRIEHHPAKKDLGYWWMISWTSEVSNVTSQPRKPTVSWAAFKEVWSSGQGRWSCPSALHWWVLTWSTASRCGVLSTGEIWTCWCVSRGRPQQWRSLPTQNILWLYGKDKTFFKMPCDSMYHYNAFFGYWIWYNFVKELIFIGQCSTPWGCSCNPKPQMKVSYISDYFQKSCKTESSFLVLQSILQQFRHSKLHSILKKY